jgi:hypothetical protein
MMKEPLNTMEKIHYFIIDLVSFNADFLTKLLASCIRLHTTLNTPINVYAGARFSSVRCLIALRVNYLENADLSSIRANIWFKILLST